VLGCFWLFFVFVVFLFFFLGFVSFFFPPPKTKKLGVGLVFFFLGCLICFCFFLGVFFFFGFGFFFGGLWWLFFLGRWKKKKKTGGKGLEFSVSRPGGGLPLRARRERRGGLTFHRRHKSPGSGAQSYRRGQKAIGQGKRGGSWLPEMGRATQNRNCLTGLQETARNRSAVLHGKGKKKDREKSHRRGGGPGSEKNYEVNPGPIKNQSWLFSSRRGSLRSGYQGGDSRGASLRDHPEGVQGEPWVPSSSTYRTRNFKTTGEVAKTAAIQSHHTGNSNVSLWSGAEKERGARVEGEGPRRGTGLRRKGGN